MQLYYKMLFLWVFIFTFFFFTHEICENKSLLKIYTVSDCYNTIILCMQSLE